MKNRDKIKKAFNGDFDLTLKKSEIIEITGIDYHYNTSKHVGTILSRMVGSGLLKRTKHGYYQLGHNIKRNKDTFNPNQTKLF